MTVSKLILVLQGIHKQHGDLEVMHNCSSAFIPVASVDVILVKEQYKRETKDIKVAVLTEALI